MNEHDHISPEDLSLFAMQALSAEESVAVRAHLEACSDCRTELATVQGDLALVALGAEQHALPAGAAQRFADRIAADAEETGRTATDSVTSITQGKPVRRVYASIQWSLVAAMVIFAFALVLRIGSLNQELKAKNDLLAAQAASSARAQKVLEVLTATSAQHVVLAAANTHPQPTGRAVYLPEKGSLVFQANNLASIAPDKAYELWVIPANGGAPIPAGLFRPDAAGNASVVLPALPAGVPAKALGVTLEKAEGSATPTSPILLSGAATAAGE